MPKEQTAAILAKIRGKFEPALPHLEHASTAATGRASDSRQKDSSEAAIEAATRIQAAVRGRLVASQKRGSADGDGGGGGGGGADGSDGGGGGGSGGGGVGLPNPAQATGLCAAVASCAKWGEQKKAATCTSVPSNDRVTSSPAGSEPNGTWCSILAKCFGGGPPPRARRRRVDEAGRR